MISIITRTVGLVTLALAVLAPAWAGSVSEHHGARPPIIATGWDSPTPKQFRDGLGGI